MLVISVLLRKGRMMLDFRKPETCFQVSFLKPYPTFFVMPNGIPLSICRVSDLSNFMVCKCNFLQLKGLLEG